MTTETAPDLWTMTCTATGCELEGVEFPVSGDDAECGGCNTVYQKR
jgi:hypothetical protein